MAKYLVLSPGQIWRLPPDTNLAQTEASISESMINGGVAYVTVEMQDNPLAQGTLLVNGRVVSSAEVLEQPDQDN